MQNWGDNGIAKNYTFSKGSVRLGLCGIRIYTLDIYSGYSALGSIQ